MSYTTGTTHYNLPQTVGSDKRDWFDTNEAFAEVDTALYGAVQDTAQAGLDITALQSDVSTINGKLSTDEGNITTLQGKVSSLESTVASQGTELTDVRRDLQDNIESSHEATATSTHSYSVGDYFFYNDVLYKATANIGVGDTIVPNTNCTGVTVMSELESGGAVSASGVSYVNTSSGLSGDDVQEAIDELADEKIDTFSGSVTDASSNTYTAVTADGIAYDATNNQLLLKVNGADTVIPFSKGGGAKGVILVRGGVCLVADFENQSYYWNNGVTGDAQFTTPFGDIIHHNATGYSITPTNDISGSKVDIASASTTWESYSIDANVNTNIDGYLLSVE